MAENWHECALAAESSLASTSGVAEKLAEASKSMLGALVVDGYCDACLGIDAHLDGCAVPKLRDALAAYEDAKK